jgi:hypothetical protein
MIGTGRNCWPAHNLISFLGRPEPLGKTANPPFSPRPAGEMAHPRWSSGDWRILSVDCPEKPEQNVVPDSMLAVPSRDCLESERWAARLTFRECAISLAANRC